MRVICIVAASSVFITCASNAAAFKIDLKDLDPGDIVDVFKDIENGIKDVGDAISGAADDTAKELKKINLKNEVNQVGKDFGKGIDDAWDELNEFAEWICTDVLDVADGDCNACYTSDRGDGEGAVYACEGGDPNQGQPGDWDNKNSPTDEQLDEIKKWADATRITHQELEPWTDGMSPFLLGEKIVGSPLPEDIKVYSPTGKDDIRTKDGYGMGHFLAPRAIWKDGKNIGTRFHGGVDFTSIPGETTKSPVNGTVIRITDAYPSNNHGLKAIVIENSGYEFKILYVNPNVKVGDVVKANQNIGTAQDLSVKFEKNMTNHIHLSVVDPQGNRVSPDEKWKIKPRKQ